MSNGSVTLSMKTLASFSCKRVDNFVQFDVFEEERMARNATTYGLVWTLGL